MGTSEVVKGGRDYIGYDYKIVNTNSDKASLYLDAYKNFGWSQDETMPMKQSAGAVTIKLKRDRKILNKSELTRLQQHFEACMDEIITLESSKARRPTMYSITIGIIGTIFMAGSVFAITHEPPMIVLCAVLGIPGLAGWALPYHLFKFFVDKRTVEIVPLIEQKHDEIHEICAKGGALTH
ncbi:MAG: hypothetical protein LBR68_01990 [Lachnoclostridium sp.]|jgi:hypothetical protein|nr:hypothetical protein [Lachnoclostridium sp.]